LGGAASRTGQRGLAYYPKGEDAIFRIVTLAQRGLEFSTRQQGNNMHEETRSHTPGEDPLPPDIEELLRDLQPEQTSDTIRALAARRLARLSESDARVVSALVVTRELDSSSVIREEAAKALRAPAHQAILDQHPDLVQQALETQRSQRDQPGPRVARAALSDTRRGAKSQPINATYEKMLREIRSWGRWSLILGAIHLLVSGFLSAAWGILLLIVGAASFYFRASAMFVVYSVTLGWVAISNILSGGSGWTVFAIFQLVLAWQVFRQYLRFRQAEAEMMIPEDLQRAADVFPWGAALLGGLAFTGFIGVLISVVVFVGVTEASDVPGIFSLLEGLTMNLGILGFAAGLASLLAGYRRKLWAVLGIIAGVLTVLVRFIIVLAF
jgi:hypothetical protein